MTCVSSDFDLVWERWHLSKLVCRVAVPFSVPRGGGYPDSTRTVALKTRNAAAAPGDLLGMESPGAHPRPTVSELGLGAWEGAGVSPHIVL